MRTLTTGAAAVLSQAARPVEVLCCGGAAIDRLYRAPGRIEGGTSNPVRGRKAFGGVALNVATNLAALGIGTALVSAVGHDAEGQALLRHIRGLGIGAEWIAVSDRHPTAEYIAAIDGDGNLAFGLADMAVLDEIALPAYHGAPLQPRPAWMFADCNLAGPLIGEVIARAPALGARLALDAVSVAKASRLPRNLHGVDLLFLNGGEAEACLGTPLQPERAIAALQGRGAREVVLTLGAEGLLVASSTGTIRRIAAAAADAVDVTGAGDALIAATLAHLVRGGDLFAAAQRGTLAAALAVEWNGSVRPDMSPALLDKAAGLLSRMSLPPARPQDNTHRARMTFAMNRSALPLDVALDVSEALACGKAVVALESTIITHGMPYPENVATAKAVEAIVRDAGAVPATIVILGGRIRIGLDGRELEALGTARGMLKLSRADLPYALAAGRDGATTVAATMICAQLAGISVFATGGIGGVHRGAETNMDISADLQELARTSVAVVCAGAKALLDLPRTVEYLETHGVPVVGYRTDEFPAFWSRTSGIPAPIRLDTPEAIAGLIGSKRALGLEGGVLVANPVAETDEIPASAMRAHIEEAVQAASAQGIAGKAVTPFILSRLIETTGGRSLATNIALIKNNAGLAAEIAVKLALARP